MASSNLDDAVGRMVARLDHTLSESPQGFPHFADQDTGAWTYSETGDWTGGFFTGQLWLAATALGHDRLRGAAVEWTRRVLPRSDSDTIFRGFLFWYGAALGDVLGDDAVARDVGLVGARSLALAYNSVGRVVPLGATAEEASDVGAYETNIDGVPGGVPLLFWAAQKSGSTSMADIARAHAERHIELCVRSDGSVCQSATFDPIDGHLVRRYTHKGVHDDSTWTRAQAWAMLGFAQAARHDQDRFADVLGQVCDWWIEHLPARQVAYWDFDDHSATAPTDTSGTAIAASALLKAHGILGNERYREVASAMVEALVAGYLDDRGILRHGCYNNRIGLATQHELIWGDYFLLEALAVLSGRLEAAAL